MFALMLIAAVSVGLIAWLALGDRNKPIFRDHGDEHRLSAGRADNAVSARRRVSEPAE
ncbi:MAG: hypothetical protein IE933_06300 [Sphingomonadales bacterium]|nr:hypothetical protein [Sphingomonadales bacterium]MBD3775063.1 hypothetical protein [Paracoccaceae bacterium]